MSSLANANDMKRVIVDDATGSFEAVAAVTGKRIRLLRCDLTLATSDTFKFTSDGTDLMGAQTLTSKVLDLASHGRFVYPWYETAVAESLDIELGGATQCSGTIDYVED